MHGINGRVVHTWKTVTKAMGKKVSTTSAMSRIDSPASLVCAAANLRAMEERSAKKIWHWHACASKLTCGWSYGSMKV